MASLNNAVTEVDKQMNAEHTVIYQVEGTANDALISYTTGDSNHSRENGVNISGGWSKEVKVSGILGASLSATNGVQDEGQITCKIIVDGTVINENTASGQLGGATCSADMDKISGK